MKRYAAIMAMLAAGCAGPPEERPYCEPIDAVRGEIVCPHSDLVWCAGRTYYRTGLPGPLPRPCGFVLVDGSLSCDATTLAVPECFGGGAPRCLAVTDSSGLCDDLTADCRARGETRCQYEATADGTAGAYVSAW